MIVTNRKEVFYKIEMTARQADNLFLLLTTTQDGHVNELSVQAAHGIKRADEIRETIIDLYTALEDR